MNYASRSMNLKVREFNTSGKNMGEANIACFRKYRHDFVYLFTTTSTLAEAMGTKMLFPEDDAPQVDEPFIKLRGILKSSGRSTPEGRPSPGLPGSAEKMRGRNRG